MLVRPAWLGQVLLDKRRVNMHVELHELPLTNRLKAVYLARLDDQDVAGTGLERLAVDGIPGPTFPDELDLVVRWRCGPGPFPGGP